MDTIERPVDFDPGYRIDVEAHRISYQGRTVNAPSHAVALLSVFDEHRARSASPEQIVIWLCEKNVHISEHDLYQIVTDVQKAMTQLQMQLTWLQILGGGYYVWNPRSITLPAARGTKKRSR